MMPTITSMILSVAFATAQPARPFAYGQSPLANFPIFLLPKLHQALVTSHEDGAFTILTCPVAGGPVVSLAFASAADRARCHVGPRIADTPAARAAFHAELARLFAAANQKYQRPDVTGAVVGGIALASPLILVTSLAMAEARYRHPRSIARPLLIATAGAGVGGAIVFLWTRAFRAESRAYGRSLLADLTQLRDVDAAEATVYRGWIKFQDIARLTDEALRRTAVNHPAPGPTP